LRRLLRKRVKRRLERKEEARKINKPTPLIT
jgi:hypothetical protein